MLYQQANNCRVRAIIRGIIISILCVSGLCLSGCKKETAETPIQYVTIRVVAVLLCEQ